MTWMTYDHVFDGQTLHADMAVQIKEGRIADLAPSPPGTQRQSGCLTPGFVDLQVNGGGGAMLNSAPTLATMITMAAAHRQFGTTSILPTVITDHPDVLDQAAGAALAAKDHSGLLGLHIEGPHIEVARRGTHNAAAIRPMDDRTMSVVAKLRAAKVPVMITVAPEAASPADIAQLAGMGAVVSIGHTDATAEQVDRAIVAGATCGTHLFNAMSPMTSRAPGTVGAILHAGLHFGIICDGHHVDDRMIALALRASTKAERAFLVSDAMATVGGPDKFDLYGQPVHLQDGRLINAEGGLAGAHFTQGEGVKRLVQQIGTPLETALRMAVTIPAAVIGRPDLASLAGRELDQLVTLDGDLNVMNVGGAPSKRNDHFSAAE